MKSNGSSQTSTGMGVCIHPSAFMPTKTKSPMPSRNCMASPAYFVSCLLFSSLSVNTKNYNGYDFKLTLQTFIQIKNCIAICASIQKLIFTTKGMFSFVVKNKNAWL